MASDNPMESKARKLREETKYSALINPDTNENGPLRDRSVASVPALADLFTPPVKEGHQQQQQPKGNYRQEL